MTEKECEGERQNVFGGSDTIQDVWRDLLHERKAHHARIAELARELAERKSGTVFQDLEDARKERDSALKQLEEARGALQKCVVWVEAYHQPDGAADCVECANVAEARRVLDSRSAREKAEGRGEAVSEPCAVAGTVDAIVGREEFAVNHDRDLHALIATLRARVEELEREKTEIISEGNLLGEKLDSAREALWDLVMDADEGELRPEHYDKARRVLDSRSAREKAAPASPNGPVEGSVRTGGRGSDTASNRADTRSPKKGGT